VYRFKRLYSGKDFVYRVFRRPLNLTGGRKWRATLASKFSIATYRNIFIDYDIT